MRSHKISLLDCTLRDGGFVNDWKFGNLTMRSIMSRLDSAGIDIIECGFLDSRCEYNNERSMYPDMPSIARTLGNAKPKSAMLVAMIDFGTFDEKSLLPKSETILHGIRLIFKKEDKDAALQYAMRIKELGFRLFVNPVALPSYSDKELLNLIDSINAVEPYAMSIVDTYGLMFNNDVMKCILMIDSNLNKCISLGYHTHNNLQMANAHCITFINQSLKREIVVDATILGMGKNAGNACTELLVSYFNKKEQTNYHLEQILDCAYTDISKFNIQSNWGYSLDNLLSAFYECSPNWLKFLKKKKTLSVKDICEILSSLPNERGNVSFFNDKMAEQLYLEHISDTIDDNNVCTALKDKFKSSGVLLLCPGKSLKDYAKKINNYIEKNRPIVISVNFLPINFTADYVFISNANRYSQLIGQAADSKSPLPKIILTSNIVENELLHGDYIVNYKKLYDEHSSANSAILLLTLLKRIGISGVSISGMDGFNTGKENYFSDTDMSIFVSDEQTGDIIKAFGKLRAENVSMKFITPSQYDTN